MRRDSPRQHRGPLFADSPRPRTLGRGLGRFVFEYLSGAHEARAFRDTAPRYALHLLEDVDPALATNWERLLDMSEDDLTACGIEMDSFSSSPMSIFGASKMYLSSSACRFTMPSGCVAASHA